MAPNPLDRRILDRFPQEERSTVANRFLGAVRRGVAEPAAVVADVRNACRERLTAAYRWGDDEYQGKTDRMLVTCTRHEDEALAYARWCLAYEAMPYEERQRLKAGHMAEGKVAAMAEKPMSDRQAAFIRMLGGDPAGIESMQQASELIERLKGGRR